MSDPQSCGCASYGVRVCQHQPPTSADGILQAALRLIEEQANDKMLWGYSSRASVRALQEALRRLHAVIAVAERW